MFDPWLFRWVAQKVHASDYYEVGETHRSGEGSESRGAEAHPCPMPRLWRKQDMVLFTWTWEKCSNDTGDLSSPVTCTPTRVGSGSPRGKEMAFSDTWTSAVSQCSGLSAPSLTGDEIPLLLEHRVQL